MMRKRYLLATVSGVGAAAAASGTAHAVPPVPAPAVSWAGWYVGVNAGVNWEQATNQSYATSEDGGSGQTNTATGFIGGGQIGYNWQDGNFVYGWEADLNALTGQLQSMGTGESNTKIFKNQITWLSTVRGRAGLAVGNTMVYATGGLAIGGVRNSFVPDFAVAPKSDTSTRVGWTIGGGIEHILWESHWTLGLEALFVDLGQSTVTVAAPGTSTGTKSAKFSNQAVIGRVKLNYKF